MSRRGWGSPGSPAPDRDGLVPRSVAPGLWHTICRDRPGSSAGQAQGTGRGASPPDIRRLERGCTMRVSGNGVAPMVPPVVITSGPNTGGSLVCMRDPDGIIVEFYEASVPRTA